MAELASDLAAEAGKMARSRWGRVRASLKTDNSVVTDADHAIQAQILAAVADTFPDHAVLAEEVVTSPDAHPHRTEARYCWVVDPLDGTRNYATGFPVFATSIAVLDRGRPVVGVVMEHNLGQVHAAVLGQGATLNGDTVRVREPEPDEELLLGVPSSKDALSVAVVRAWTGQAGFVLRNLGATAVHIAMVSSGMLAGAFGKRCKVWDLAAGVLIVSEAGGRVTDPRGGALFPFSPDRDPRADMPFLAAPPQLHERLLSTLPIDGAG